MPTARVDQGVPGYVVFDVRQDGVAIDLGADNADGSPFFSGAYFPPGFGFDVGSLSVAPPDPNHGRPDRRGPLRRRHRDRSAGRGR